MLLAFAKRHAVSRHRCDAQHNAPGFAKQYRTSFLSLFALMFRGAWRCEMLLFGATQRAFLHRIHAHEIPERPCIIMNNSLSKDATI